MRETSGWRWRSRIPGRDQADGSGGAAVGEQGGVSEKRQLVADQAGVDAGEDAAAQDGDGAAAVELRVMAGDADGGASGLGEQVALPGAGGEQKSAEAGVGGDGFGGGVAIGGQANRGERLARKLGFDLDGQAAEAWRFCRRG